MKPISQLKCYKASITVSEVLVAFLKLMKNPKRHLRGPLRSSEPGNGKYCQSLGKKCTALNTVSVCALGALNFLTNDPEVQLGAENLLNKASVKLYPDTLSFIGVSDEIGLKAIRRVVNEALKDLQTT